MTPTTMALLLAAIALVVLAYVVACDYTESGVPGPESMLDQSRPGIVARRDGDASAQDKGSCLPGLVSRVAAGRTNGVRGNDAPALTSAPAGVPGGSGSPGATSEAV